MEMATNNANPRRILDKVDRVGFSSKTGASSRVRWVWLEPLPEEVNDLA